MKGPTLGPFFLTLDRSDNSLRLWFIEFYLLFFLSIQRLMGH